MTAAPAFASGRPVVLGFVTLAVLGGGLFGWGTLASIAGAVIATGRVEVETREQVVEHIDGGTVGAVLVRDGDRVAAGQVLVRLEDEALRSEEAMLEAEHAELVARRNRLEAEFRDADTITWDGALAGLAERDAAVRAVLDGQRRLFEARRSSRAGQAAQLRERIGQTRRQIAGLDAQGDAVRRQRGFIARELEAQRELFDKKLTKLRPLMELEREAARLDGQAGDIEARVAGARGRVAELGLEILQIDTRRIEQAEGQAREAQARENQVRERLADVRRRLGGMEVRAPVAGEVFGMTVFAVGEVIRPGEPILRVVPSDAGLVVRAQLEPIHVDQVWPGQEAVLLFSAFPARTTPQFAGRVRHVSADAALDARTGLSWYEVEISMGQAIEPEGGPDPVAWLVAALPESVAGWTGARDEAGHPEEPARARELALAPGMPVEVLLRTGQRSPLDYLAKPLTDYFSRSMREE